MSNQLIIHGGSEDGYTINRSLRFRSSASSYLNRTPATGSNQQKWTLSLWIKRGKLGAVYHILNARNLSPSAPYTMIDFEADDTLLMYDSGGMNLKTTQVFRDASAWYHIVYAIDTTQATAANRAMLYVNGVQVTSFTAAAYPAQNANLAVNSVILHLLGAASNGAGGYTQWFDGLWAETNFVDGQQLSPVSFGQNDPVTGVWQPKKYTGTYGTNGFYLPFSDNSSTTTLGYDKSGNGNNWTCNNISLTAGATYDSMNDVPTLTSSSKANYPVINPLKGGATVSNGNLAISGGDDQACTMVCPSTGKWYAEFIWTNATQSCHFGVYDNSRSPIALAKSILYRNDGLVYVNNVNTTSFGSYTAGDVISVMVDLDVGNVYFSKNNVYQGSVGLSSASISVSDVIFGMRCNSGVTATANFGQQPFVYPPSTSKALNTFNLPDPTIGATASSRANKYFDVSLYTGNGSTQSITNSGGFQPDWVWGKSRSTAIGHGLYDAVRGATKWLGSESTAAEQTYQGVTAFNSNGFSVGSSSDVNNNASTFVAWQWKANGTGSTNTAGSITSTVSANTTSGFSIVTYTGNGTAGATVGHGLGVAPSMIIIKQRSSVSGIHWRTYHKSLSANGSLYLNLTNAYSGTDAGFMNLTSPTSSVFSVGNDGNVNGSAQPHVAYCFAEVAGFSKFGSYTGNGSTDGTFVYTGFRPKYVMMKLTSSAGGDWCIVDTSRDTYNTALNTLIADGSSAEFTGSGTASAYVDIVSNGFKLKTTNGGTNGNGSTYIYMAFAENPFKYSLAR